MKRRLGLLPKIKFALSDQKKQSIADLVGKALDADLSPIVTRELAINEAKSFVVGNNMHQVLCKSITKHMPANGMVLCNPSCIRLSGSTFAAMRYCNRLDYQIGESRFLKYAFTPIVRPWNYFLSLSIACS